MTQDAVISKCSKYRYSLSRQWNKEKDKVLFIMLNPSKADDKIDDPTDSILNNYLISAGKKYIFMR